MTGDPINVRRSATRITLYQPGVKCQHCRFNTTIRRNGEPVCTYHLTDSERRAVRNALWRGRRHAAVKD